MMMIFIRKANLAPCYVLFLSILRRRKVRRVLEDVESRREVDVTYFLQFQVIRKL